MAAFAPKLPPSVRRLFRLPGSRARMLRDLDEELRTHLAMRIDDLRSLGMSEAEAEAEALRRFGDTAEFRTYAERRVARAATRLRVAESLAQWTQDLRYAGRQVARAPGFTAIAGSQPVVRGPRAARDWRVVRRIRRPPAGRR